MSIEHDLLDPCIDRASKKAQRLIDEINILKQVAQVRTLLAGSILLSIVSVLVWYFL